MAVVDLGEGLGGYSLLLATSRNTKDSLHWYKNALKHINFCIKYHFYITQNITSPYLLRHCTHHASWFICMILCILLALFKKFIKCALKLGFDSSITKQPIASVGLWLINNNIHIIFLGVAPTTLQLYIYFIKNLSNMLLTLPWIDDSSKTKQPIGSEGLCPQIPCFRDSSLGLAPSFRKS